MTYRMWTLGRTTLVFSLALAAAAACGGAETPTDSAGGAAGAATGGTGTGGTGTGGTGGTVVSSGGRTNEAGNGGEGGRDSMPPPEGEFVLCQLDADCEEFGQVCAGFRRICVDCDETSDCDTGEVCVRDSCEARSPCEDSLDCPTTDLVCVSGEGGPGPGPGAGEGLCLECESDADCDEEEGCTDNVCVRACASDKDCTPLGLLCDFDSGTCAECFGGARCDDGEYCADGTCVDAVCTPGDTVCFGNGISACNEMGSGYGDVDPCFDGACDVVDGEATCVPD